MANEITLTQTLTVTKNTTTATLSLSGLSINMTGTAILHHRVEVGTSEEAILLGDAGVGGWFMAINRDATNFVSIRQATAASDLIRMQPGEGCVFRIDDDATAPFWIADTGACEVEYLLIED